MERERAKMMRTRLRAVPSLTDGCAAPWSHSAARLHDPCGNLNHRPREHILALNEDANVQRTTSIRSHRLTLPKALLWLIRIRKGAVGDVHNTARLYMHNLGTLGGGCTLGGGRGVVVTAVDGVSGGGSISVAVVVCVVFVVFVVFVFVVFYIMYFILITISIYNSYIYIYIVINIIYIDYLIIS